MRYSTARWRLFGLALALALLLGAQALAQTGLRVDWWTVDGGGGGSGGGSFTLSGTGGQADAGAIHGGSFTIQGGFWGSGAAPPVETRYVVALPLIRR